MPDVTIYGADFSNYVWAARMVCEEKGITHDLQPIAMRSDELLAVNPYGKIPVLRHGDFTLCETSAIMRYVNEAFDGPDLIPGNARDRARMEHWISAINAYFDPCFIRRYVLAYFHPQTEDGQPDRARIDAEIPSLNRYLGIIEAGLSDGPWLLGESPTLADFLLSPILFYLKRYPESREIVEKSPNINRFLEAAATRPSFQKTIPGVGKK